MFHLPFKILAAKRCPRIVTIDAILELAPPCFARRSNASQMTPACFHNDPKEPVLHMTPTQNPMPSRLPGPRLATPHQDLVSRLRLRTPCQDLVPGPRLKTPSQDPAKDPTQDRLPGPSPRTPIRTPPAGPHFCISDFPYLEISMRHAPCISQHHRNSQ